MNNAKKTSIFKGHTVTYRLGSKLTVGTRLIWNYHTGSIVAIDEITPKHFNRNGTQVIIQYFYWKDDRTGAMQRAQLCAKTRYRIEASASDDLVEASDTEPVNE
jgi:hypothetical protein